MYKLLLLGLLAIISVTCSTMVEPLSSTFDLAIKNVKVFDSKTKQVHANKTILIKGDIIAEVVEATQTFNATKIIEGKNKLVTPGFIDTHVHLQGIFKYSNDHIPELIEAEMEPTYKSILAEQFLNFGVTTIIDMGQKDKWVDETIKWQKNPSPDFPNLFINGSSIISDEKRRPAPHHLEVMSPELAAKKVKEYAAKGLKYMKLYSRLRAPEMKAIIAEATKHDITLNAHVDNNVVTIPQAMDYGVRNFEHFFTLSPSILAYNEHWVLLDHKYKLKGIKGIDDFSASMSFFFDYIKSEPAYTKKLHSLFDRMSEEKATLSTAFHVLGSTAGKTDFFSSFNHFPIRNVPKLNQYTSLQKEQLGTAFDAMMAFAKTAHDKGVKLRIGTDCNHGGRALVSELGLFIKAGFSVEDLLQIATWNGYKAMKLDRDYGTIEKGKKADLLIFDKDPLAKAKHLLEGKTVIKGGKVYQPKTAIAFTFLDKILNQDLATALTWFDQQKNTATFELDPNKMKMVPYHLYYSGKADEAVEVLKLNTKLFPEKKDLVEEFLLNDVGYFYLGKNNFLAAIEVLQWNTQLFPKSWNVYDSLGEAYMKNKNVSLAIENYEKSLVLNPENEYGIKALAELKKK